MRFTRSSLRSAISLYATTLILMIACQICAFSDLNPKTPIRLHRPRLVIFKSKRQLELYDGKELLRSYAVALGKNPVGEKVRQGDFKTPEGEFILAHKNPKSRFTLSMALSYPNNSEAEIGLNAGLISKAEYRAILKANHLGLLPPQHTKLGGDVMIHGGGIGEDWTWGCVALEDKDIRELFRILPTGTKVVIKP